MQFEEKLHIFHLVGVDLRSMNHSREFIRAFVMASMTVVDDRRIERHLHVVDAVTGRKRILAFVAGKVTELHTRDAFALMVMSKGGELQAVF